LDSKVSAAFSMNTVASLPLAPRLLIKPSLACFSRKVGLPL
jgi:hypothetical protein